MTTAADRKKVNLTDAFCRSAKAIGGTLTEYPDAKERGLALRVTPGGIRSWTFRYRNLAGQQKRLSLGRLDDVSLVEARGRAASERSRVHNKLDPAALAKAERETARLSSKLETVKDVGDRYFLEAERGRHKPNAKRSKRNSTVSLEKGYFEKYIVPRFGKDRLADLTRARIQALINDVADGAKGIEHSSKSAARQCKVVLQAIFNFAIWQEIVTANPCQLLTVPQFEPRERVLKADELKTFWHAVQSAGSNEKLFVSRPVALALLLCAATLQRRAEVAQMQKTELDIRCRTWIIDGKRTKNHRTHVVPLSDLAIGLIDEAISLSDNSEYVFPSPRSGEQDAPIEPPALSHAFRRVCKSVKLRELRTHDLRRTGATELTRNGVSRFIVSQVLNHSDSGGAALVTAVYDQNSYLPEKRSALDRWADELRGIVDGGPCGEKA